MDAGGAGCESGGEAEKRTWKADRIARNGIEFKALLKTKVLIVKQSGGRKSQKFDPVIKAGI